MRLTQSKATSSHVTAISSKSYVHRLIIAASLYGEGTCIITNIMSADMEATVRAVNALGADVKVIRSSDDRYEIRVVRPLGSKITNSCVVDCGESGSTARFILPLAAFFADEATVTGLGRLPERPMGPLCDVLRSAGVTVSADNLPITVSGDPLAGEYEIAGNVSSQFISGLLFLLPLLDGRSTLTITGKLESAAYVDMTVDVLAKFGVSIERSLNVFTIDPPLKNMNEASRCIVSEGDWSNAAYIMTIASLGSGKAFDSLTIDGLAYNSIQGDRAVADIMRDFGIDVSLKQGEDPSSSGYTIKGRPTKPVDVDCSQIPDLVPALAVLAAYAEGDSIFRNVERLRMKECDRIDAVSQMLSTVHVMVDITSDHETGSETMIVHGKGGSSPVVNVPVIDSFNDHRIAMAAAAIALAEDVPVIINDPMAVNKSYPGFYDVVATLGIANDQGEY